MRKGNKARVKRRRGALGEELVAAMDEAVAHAEGRASALRTHAIQVQVGREPDAVRRAPAT